MIPELPDDLWQRIYDGHEDAWQELVRRTEKPLTVTVYAIVLNWDDAQDIVQSTFGKFVEQIRLRSTRRDFFRRPEGFLWTLARNFACDRLRQLHRQAEAAKSVLEHASLFSRDDPYRAEYLETNRRIIPEIVAELSRELRDLYRLRYIERKTQCQAAEVLGRDPKTVRKRERQLARQVYCRLKQLGFD